MWKRLLKYRDLAKTMHKVDVKSGISTSFWYDHWSQLGRLFDATNPRRVIDMGIPLEATLETVLQTHRRRRHRVEIYNNIEAEKLLRTYHFGDPRETSSENSSSPKLLGTMSECLSHK